VLDGKSIKVGDAILGLPSSGLHTNGYSLVRRCFDLSDTDVNQARDVLGKRFDEIGGVLGDVLLAPHRCYGPMLKPLLPKLKGMAHITGGGLVENVPRILPAGLAARFFKNSWPVLPIFNLIQRTGAVEEAEMYRVFNMGIGMVLVVAGENVDSIRKALPEALLIGEIAQAENEIRVIIED
jgi:phosphoribosylformylglycinamidine cyclo-ligase